MLWLTVPNWIASFNHNPQKKRLIVGLFWWCTCLAKNENIKQIY